MKNVTMKDISEKLEVSIVTVSKALSDKEGVGEELRELIKQTANELGYKYSGGLKTKKEGYSYNIGVLIPERFTSGENDIEDAFYMGMYQSLVKHLVKYDYNALLEIISSDNEKECVPPNSSAPDKTDGLVIIGQLKQNYLEFILKLNKPVVFLDFYDKKYAMDSILSDNFKGGYNITSYLIDNGHKQIGFLGNIHATNSILDRYLGYIKALLENRFQLVPEWLIDDRDEEGRICEFILPDHMPTAFVCNCDSVAYTFIKLLQKKGYRIPEDISVVGFDNFIYSKLCNPPITTLEVEVNKMTEITAKAIIHKINNPKYTLGQKIVAGNVIIRESVKTIDI